MPSSAAGSRSSSTRWPTTTARRSLADLIAGLTVGLVALPLAMAFGIASGVTPQAGIYTAIVGGLVVSVLGGSRIQIGGPTGAFVVIVAGIIARHGLYGLLMVTMMAGVILLDPRTSRDLATRCGTSRGRSSSGLRTVSPY